MAISFENNLESRCSQLNTKANDLLVRAKQFGHCGRPANQRQYKAWQKAVSKCLESYRDFVPHRTVVRGMETLRNRIQLLEARALSLSDRRFPFAMEIEQLKQLGRRITPGPHVRIFVVMVIYAGFLANMIFNRTNNN